MMECLFVEDKTPVLRKDATASTAKNTNSSAAADVDLTSDNENGADQNGDGNGNANVDNSGPVDLTSDAEDMEMNRCL